MYSNIHVSSSTLIPIDRKVRGQFLYFMTDLGKSDSDAMTCLWKEQSGLLWLASREKEEYGVRRRSARNLAPEAFILSCRFPEPQHLLPPWLPNPSDDPYLDLTLKRHRAVSIGKYTNAPRAARTPKRPLFLWAGDSQSS